MGSRLPLGAMVAALVTMLMPRDYPPSVSRGAFLCRPAAIAKRDDDHRGLQGAIQLDFCEGSSDCGTPMPTASCAKAAELMVGPHARR